MKIKHLALAVALGLSLPSVALANTSSSMRGVVTTPQGTAAAGTKVTIVHVPTGTRTVVTVNEAGVFNAVGLRVGGPYRVEVDSDVYADKTFSDVFLTLGETANLNVQLEQDTGVERIQISARQTTLNLDATGPSAVFGFADLQNAPTVSRDIKNVIEQDPRISIDDPSASSAIKCAGGHSRANSLSVDGIRMNDNFGLQYNGYPTERLPFPFDAIDQVAVELAPFDVTYGGFSGCAINAVTRSGTNEFHGSVFVDYTNDSMTGDKIEGRKLQVPSFNEKRYGLTLGFPIIQDQLFAFIALEKHNPFTSFANGPTGGGFLNEQAWLTVAQAQAISAVAKSKYGYDTNPLDIRGDNQERKILAKVDWQINQDHRAFLTYQDTKGDTTSSTNSGSTSFAFNDHFYNKSNHLRSVATQFFSDWTNSFSTNVRVAWQDVNNGQVPRASQKDFGQFVINNVNGSNRVFFGPDQFRHANKLQYDTLNLKVEGKYFLDEHEITGGFETERTDVFNLFVHSSNGIYTFNSLADFEQGIASRVTYRNAPSLNPDDAAASFTLKMDSVYLQDKYAITSDLTVTYGLRYDQWSTDKAPNLNQNFATRYGFNNNNQLNLSLLQPRIGFNYVVDDTMVVYGGAGLFSGGNPNVWFSATYSNDGIRILASDTTDSQMPLDVRNSVLNSVNTPNFGFNIPGPMVAPAYFRGGDGEVDALDPNLKAPSIWKLNLGTQKELTDSIVVGADVIYSRDKNPLITKDLRLVNNGIAPDGRPVYRNCVTNVNNPSGPCISRASSDLLITNSSLSPTGTVFSTFADWKALDNLSLRGGYAYQSVKEVMPLTGTTVIGNQDRFATSDQNNVGIATSNYEIPHRFTLSVNYSADLITGYPTRFSLSAQRAKGTPFSYTFNGDPGFGDASGASRGRNLFYVPLAGNDPKVTYGPLFDQQAFNEYLVSSGLDKYRGQIAPRNGFYSPWWSRVDLKISQDLPGFIEGHSGQVYLSIYNLGNLLNDDWGVRKQFGGFEYTTPIVTATTVNGQYSYNQFSNRTASVQDRSSAWSMVLGLQYVF